MNSALEQGILKFLRDLLDAAPASQGAGDERVTYDAATIGGKPVSFHANIANDVMPENITRATVAIGNMNHEVGALYLPELSIVVTTPLKAGLTRADHAAAVEAIRAAFVQDNWAALDAACQDQSAFSVGSLFEQDVLDSESAEWLQADLKFKLCAVEQV